VPPTDPDVQDSRIRLFASRFRYVRPSITYPPPASLSVRAWCRCLWGSTSLTSFPPTVPCHGTSFPPRGPTGWFPRFAGTTRCSDFSPLVTRRFVAFASRLPLSRAEAVRPPRFLRDPCARAPLSDPGGLAAFARTIRAGRPTPSRGDSAFRACDGVGAHHKSPFGAQSRGPRARCLRFAATVTRVPRKTRFRLVVHLAGRLSLLLEAAWVPS